MSRTLNILALVVLGSALHAHGGIYKPPGDSGGVMPPGGGSVPPTAPSPGGPGGPPSGGSRPDSGSTPPAGQRNVGRNGNESVDTTEVGFAWDSWVFWWEYNKDRFLTLRDRLAQKSKPRSLSSSVLTGLGRRDAVQSARRPDPQEIREQVLPALRALLANERDRDILDSAALALARSTEEERGDTVALLTPLLAHKELSVQTSAALSLGVLGAKAAVPLLLELAANSADGRRLAGGGAVPPQLRSFAILGLGLCGDASATVSLTDLAQHLSDSDRDLRVAAVTALGLLPEAAHGEAVSTLLELLGNRRVDAIVRAQVPVALARLGATEALPRLLEVLKSKDADDLVRESAAIALGRLGALTDATVTGALLDAVTASRDAQTRHFALIALADLGVRAADAPGTEEAQLELAAALRKQLERPKFREQRAWAGLATAIHARAVPAAAPAAADALRAAWRTESDPAERGAYALGLGLLQDPESADELFEAWGSEHESTLRGYIAVALGFLRHEPARESLRACCASKATTPTLRLQAATALGLMSDEPAVPVLITALQDAQTDGVASACARSLGLIGDRLALPPLLEMLRDTARPASVRAFATVATGLLAERSALPWHARLRADVNYRARSPVLDEVLDIL